MIPNARIRQRIRFILRLLWPILLLLAIVIIFILFSAWRTVDNLNWQQVNTRIIPFDDPVCATLDLVTVYTQQTFLDIGEFAPGAVSLSLVCNPLPTAISASATSPTKARNSSVEPPSYTVEISLPSSVEDGIVIYNEDDINISPRFTMTLAADGQSPVVFYLRPLRDLADLELTAHVYTAGGQALLPQQNASWTIQTETALSAILRQFGIQVIPLLLAFAGLFTTIINLRSLFKEEQEQAKQAAAEEQARVEAIKAQLTTLRQTLAQADYNEAIPLYIDLKTEAEQTGWPEDARQKLIGVWDTAPGFLRTVEAFHTSHREKIDSNELADLVQGYQKLDRNWQINIIEILIKVFPELSDKDKKQVLHLSTDERIQHWQAILETWPTVHPWHVSKTLEQAIEQGLQKLADTKRIGTAKSKDLRHPFLTNSAELDPFLMENALKLEVLSRAKRLEPGIITGESGSGKTALALLLSKDCIPEPVFTAQEDIPPHIQPVQAAPPFPIYYPALLDYPATQTLDGLARAVADTLLHYWAILPSEFLEEDPNIQAAAAHLIGHYCGSYDQFKLRFQQAGGSTSNLGKQVLQIFTKLLGKINFDSPLHKHEYLALISKATPRKFENIFMLVDFPPARLATMGTGQAAEHIQPLVHLMDDLAGTNIFVKLFLPVALQNTLTIPATIPILPIEWSREQLSNLLRWRLKNAGVTELADWCAYDVVKPLDWLLDEAEKLTGQGKPGQLFFWGSELVKRVKIVPFEGAVITNEAFEQVLP
jgi:hypothetical protein